MLAKQGKQKSAAAWKGRALAEADRLMRRWFHLPEGWHLQRDIVKNNFELGVKHYRLGRESDALLRLKLAVWLDANHAEAWYYLGRACLAAGKRRQGIKALKKSAAMMHKEAETLLAAAVEPATAIAVQDAGAGAAALARIHRDSFPAPWSEKEISDLLAVAGTRAWLAGVPQLAMGMMMGRSLSEQYEVLTLAVSPEWRGRGVAKKLLERLLADAKAAGAKSVFLEVAEDNQARWFYARAGFAEISRRNDYYQKPEGGFADALVMRLELA